MPENPEGEQHSLLEQLPQTVTHAEIKADNERRWRAGVVPTSDQPQAITRPEPEEGVLGVTTGGDRCR